MEKQKHVRILAQNKWSGWMSFDEFMSDKYKDDFQDITAVEIKEWLTAKKVKELYGKDFPQLTKDL